MYSFPGPRPFAGAHLYNPYARVGERWLKVNLHAHARAWGGLTNGRGSNADVQARYRAAGYDIGITSNYFDPAQVADTSEVTAYEQGFNLNKTHLLVLGTSRVDWADLPFVESASQKQMRIDRVLRDGGLPIVLHPELRDGYTAADLRQLTSYPALEVVSHFGDALAYWDDALTAGRLVWAVGDDDAHNIADSNQVGRAWTMVAAENTSRAAVLGAIRAGGTYAVKGRNGSASARLLSLTTRGDTLTVRTAGAPATILFLGRQGRELGRREATHEARFILARAEPYARVVVRAATTTLYLNPVVRTTEGLPAPMTARVDEAATGVQRVSAVACLLLLLAGLFQSGASRESSDRVMALPLIARSKRQRRRQRAA